MSEAYIYYPFYVLIIIFLSRLACDRAKYIVGIRKVQALIALLVIIVVTIFTPQKIRHHSIGVLFFCKYHILNKNIN
jgi:hypothetical protein